MKQALAEGAAAVLAHNHPSGGLSRRGRTGQSQRLQALGLMDIRVLDHLVVGDGHTVSFAQRGLALAGEAGYALNLLCKKYTFACGGVCVLV